MSMEQECRERARKSRKSAAVSRGLFWVVAGLCALNVGAAVSVLIDGRSTWWINLIVALMCAGNCWSISMLRRMSLDTAARWDGMADLEAAVTKPFWA